MKFACTRNLFKGPLDKRSMGPPIREVLKNISELGFDGMEIGHGEIFQEYKTPEDFARDLRKYGIVLTATYWGLPLDTTSERENIVERAVSTAGQLKIMGCHRLLINPPSKWRSPWEGRNLANFAKRKYILDACDSLNEIGAKLNQHKVKIGVHPHWGDVLEDRDGLDLLMEFTDSKLVDLFPDTGHLCAMGCNILDVFRDYRDRISYVHIKDMIKPLVPLQPADSWHSLARDLGEGEIDFISVMRIVKEDGLADWCVMDQDFPVGTTSLECAKKAISYIDKFLKPVFQS